MISVPLIRYVLMAALRDRLVLTLVLVCVVGSCLAVFLGSAAIVEKRQFALVFAASGLRFSGVAGLVLFCVFYVRRAFETRDVEYLLSRPIGRTAFILSHAVAFSLLAALLAVAAGAVILALSFGTMAAGQGLWVLGPWILGLIAEFVIAVNAALFFSMVLPSATAAALATFGLYTLGRLMGELLGDAAADYGGAVLGPALKGAMNVVSMAMPRLDLMTQTAWLVHPGAPHNVGVGYILAQGAVYAGLLVTAAVADLRRRQF